MWLNTRSLSEMPQASIANYMSEIGRTGRGYLLHDNANRTHFSDVMADTFPIPSDFKLLSKKKSVWYTTMLDNRFVEYLYQKA